MYCKVDGKNGEYAGDNGTESVPVLLHRTAQYVRVIVPATERKRKRGNWMIETPRGCAVIGI